MASSRNVALCFLEAAAERVSIYRSAGFSALFDYAAFHRESSSLFAGATVTIEALWQKTAAAALLMRASLRPTTWTIPIKTHV